MLDHNYGALNRFPSLLDLVFIKKSEENKKKARYMVDSVSKASQAVQRKVDLGVIHDFDKLAFTLGELTNVQTYLISVAQFFDRQLNCLEFMKKILRYHLLEKLSGDRKFSNASQGNKKLQLESTLVSSQDLPQSFFLTKYEIFPPSEVHFYREKVNTVNILLLEQLELFLKSLKGNVQSRIQSLENTVWSIKVLLKAKENELRFS